MISIISFENAVASRLSEALAARVKAALSVVEPDPIGLTFHDAGELVVLAALAGEPAKSKAELETIELSTAEVVTGDGASVFLDHSSALAHPLLALWAHASIEGVFGEAIRAGTELTQLAPGAPVFDSFELIAVSGVCVAGLCRLHFAFNGSTAIFHYGDLQALTSPLAVHTKITGDALVEIGQSIRLNGIACPSAAPAQVSAETRH